jgi:hypothetical protein
MQSAAQNGAEKRLKAQNDMVYYSNKIEEEQAKIAAAGELVDQLQEEYTVGNIVQSLIASTDFGVAGVDGEGGAILRTNREPTQGRRDYAPA